MNDVQAPQLIIEAGPERGREILIPEAGARIGRAHENDIELADPTLSRFQCRMYYRDNVLHVLDLGSTNCTMVNGKDVQDAALSPGDEILIGEMTIRVARNVYTGGNVERAKLAESGMKLTAERPSEPPAAEPIPAGEEAVPTAPEPPRRLSDSHVDLGLQPAAASELARKSKAQGGATRPISPLKFWILAGLLIVLALLAAYVVVMKPATPAGGNRAANPVADTLHLVYEKIDGSTENIFRYAATVAQGQLRVEINDLESQRKIAKEKDLAEEVIDGLKSQLRQLDFESLPASLEGVNPGRYEVRDLQITLGPRTHRCRVFNRVEPAEFQKVRELVEEFVKTEMGLEALALSPEQLRERAQAAFLNGRKYFEERNNPTPDNLWNAIKAFTEVEWYLESVEPKPDLYAQAIQLKSTSTQELDTRYEDYKFRVQRHYQLKEYEEAARMLRAICAMIPDRNDDRHDRARRALVQIENLIKQ